MSAFALLVEQIDTLLRGYHRVIIAIDGMCASGKTTLAARLSARFENAPVIHMDDFYLPRDRQSEEAVGGHMDFERFCEQVITPFKKGETPLYDRFSCCSQDFIEHVSLPDARLYIVEGSYSTHPAIPDIYDLRIFLRLSPEEQMSRLTARDPEKIKDFREKWIPRENRFFATYMTELLADTVIDSWELSEETVQA